MDKCKYTTWYFNIINNAAQDESAYFENHHIVPKSLGGNNNKENLVKLTGREHFICHWLLTKMVEPTNYKYKMWNAFSCMLYRGNDTQQRYKISGRIFENIKKTTQHLRSNRIKGERNPMFNKTHSSEAKKKISKTHKGRKRPKATCDKLSLLHKGKPKSEEHKQALKETWERTKEKRSGENASFYGCSHSAETKEKIRQKVKSMPKEKIRQKVKSMPKEKCIHCGFETTRGNIRRWHNNNCKSK